MRPIENKPKPHFKCARQSQSLENDLELIETTEIRFRGKVLKVVSRVVTRFNITRPLFDSLLGPKHSHFHRMTTGMLVMMVGVFVAKVGGHHPVMWVAGLGDMVGYAIHGLGLTPFAVFLSEKFEKVGE